MFAIWGMVNNSNSIAIVNDVKIKYFLQPLNALTSSTLIGFSFTVGFQNIPDPNEKGRITHITFFPKKIKRRVFYKAPFLTKL